MIATKKIVSTATLAALAVLACPSSTAHVGATAMYSTDIYPKCEAKHFQDAYDKYQSKFNGYISSLPDTKCFKYSGNKFWEDETNEFYKLFLKEQTNGDPINDFARAMCQQECSMGVDSYSKTKAALYIFQKPEYKDMGTEIKCSLYGKNVEKIMDEAWKKRSDVCKNPSYGTSSTVQEYKAPPMTDASGESAEGEGDNTPAAQGATAPSPNAPAPAPAPNTDKDKKAKSGATVVSTGVTFLVTLASLVLAATTMF